MPFFASRASMPFAPLFGSGSSSPGSGQYLTMSSRSWLSTRAQYMLYVISLVLRRVSIRFSSCACMVSSTSAKLLFQYSLGAKPAAKARCLKRSLSKLRSIRFFFLLPSLYLLPAQPAGPAAPLCGPGRASSAPPAQGLPGLLEKWHLSGPSRPPF